MTASVLRGERRLQREVSGVAEVTTRNPYKEPAGRVDIVL